MTCVGCVLLFSQSSFCFVGCLVVLLPSFGLEYQVSKFKAATINIFFFMITVNQMKGVAVNYDQLSLQFPLSSTGLYSIFQLIVLVLWPATLTV